MPAEGSPRPGSGGARRRTGAEERPLFLTLGVVLTTLRSAGILVFAGLMALADTGSFALELFADDPTRLVPFVSLQLGSDLRGLALVAGYYGLLVLCGLLAWQRSRRATVLLLVLSALGLLHSGPLGLTIQGITLLGCGQALRARSGRPPAPGL